MAEMSERQNNNNQASFSRLPNKINSPATLTPIARNIPRSNSRQGGITPKQADLIADSNRLEGDKLPQSTFFGLPTKTAAILVGTAVMLPILAVGTATYHFGSQGIERQTILAKRAYTIELAEAELVREKQLLAALLMGTGTTALLAGAAATLGTKKLLEGISAIPEQTTNSEDEAETNLELVYDLSQSVARRELLDTVVEEARICLNCDRVVIYSLDSNKYGVVVAESVAAGYTKALGKTIADPCFEARYLEKYRDGRVKAIDDVYNAEITPCYLEQLEQLEVKANLVTPIINDGKLFGLLVAHQCESPRQWQSAEIEFLDWLAKKTGFALENARLRENLEQLETEADRERKWTQYFTDAVRYIRQSIKQDDVLEISVEEVRRVLECDRVVVYSLGEHNYGVVVAESVAAGYPRALHKTIEDPCFEARYLDKYRDGRVRAIDNIYEAGMSECYVQQLATLEVKANLVTPILNEGELFGLLVAHQCSQPRHWQDYEIRWMTQVATQVGFAVDNAKILVESAARQTEAARERKWTQYFTDAVRYIRQSIKQDDVLEISVEEVRRVLECDRVVVYSLGEHNYGVVVAESVAAGYPRALHKTIEDPCFAARYLDKYRDGRVRAIDNIYEAGMSECYVQQLAILEVKANLVTPILNEGELFGLLVAHQCSQPRHWQDYEIRWMTQVATQVGFALDNAAELRRSHLDLPTQLLNNFSLGINERVNRSQLLKTAVEQARQVIKLDRAVVYQFDANWNGKIVAESVVPGYPRAINSQFNDPCFARYREQYCRGRVKAIADVERANLTECHLEQLTSLAVKASLIVPILQDGELSGLLIGHQCQQARSWNSWEIELFTQLALQLGAALERVKLREELKLAELAQNQIGQQPESSALPEKISELLVENQAILQAFKEKFNRFSDRERDRSDRPSTPPSLPMGEVTLEASEIVSPSASTAHNYYPELELITGEILDKSPSTSNLLLMNQFVGEITNLSERISQQSLYVTKSFQKLAAFAKQLSENSHNDERANS